jgi:hypothetical protein
LEQGFFNVIKELQAFLGFCSNVPVIFGYEGIVGVFLSSRKPFCECIASNPKFSPRTGLYPKNAGTLEQAYIYIFYNYIIIIFQQLNPRKQSPILFQSTGTTLEQLEQKTHPVSAKKITYHPCSICKVVVK